MTLICRNPLNPYLSFSRPFEDDDGASANREPTIATPTLPLPAELLEFTPPASHGDRQNRPQYVDATYETGRENDSVKCSACAHHFWLQG